MSEAQSVASFLPFLEEYIKPFLQNIIPQVGKFAKDALERKKMAEEVKSEYACVINDLYGKIQILTMRAPIDLEDIFVTPKLLEDIDMFSYKDEGEEVIKHGRRYFLGRDTRRTIEISSLLKKNNGKYTILGDPGAGKSTLLRAMALASIKDHASLKDVQQKKFPIYIELRRYAEYSRSDRKASLLDFFCARYSSKDAMMSIVEKLAEVGSCIFLFDALDEVASNLQQKVVNKIQDLEIKYPNCTFIISSRIGDYRYPITGYSVYEISEFEEQSVDKFVDKWFALHPKGHLADSLKENIRENKGLSEISTNPLLLSLVCLLYSQDLLLPRFRAQLYKRCIETIIRDWDASRDFRRESVFDALSEKRMGDLLSEVAYFYMTKGKRYFRKSEFIKVVADMIDKYDIEGSSAENVVFEICSHNGLIVNVGAEKMGFSHLTFQEFLSAQYYVNNNVLHELIDLYVDNPRMHETLILSAGIMPSSDSLVNMVIKQPNLSIDRKIRFIANIISQGEAVTTKAIRGVINEFIENSLKTILESFDCYVIGSKRVNEAIEQHKDHHDMEDEFDLTTGVYKGFKIKLKSSEINLDPILILRGSLFMFGSLKIWTHYTDKSSYVDTYTGSKKKFVNHLLSKTYRLIFSVSYGKTYEIYFEQLIE